MPDTLTCPVGIALELNRSNLTREYRQLRHNINLCKTCEAKNGLCGKFIGLIAYIKAAITQALDELGLGDPK